VKKNFTREVPAAMYQMLPIQIQLLLYLLQIVIPVTAVQILLEI